MVRLAALIISVLLAGCAGQPQLNTVTQSAAFNAVQADWIRCTFDEADRLLWADRDPFTIAIAANSACERYPLQMQLMFLRAGISEHRFMPLMDGLERRSRQVALTYVLDKRTRTPRPRE